MAEIMNNPKHTTGFTGLIPALFMATLILGAAPAHAGFRLMTAADAPAENDTQLAPTSLNSRSVTLGSAAVPAPALAASARTGMVEGFASDVPLTVALRQVLPRGVMYTIADDVDTSTSVSWNGGRDWQTVLNDMLGKAGLRAAYSQNTVLIEKSGMAAAAPSFTLHEPVVVDSAPAPSAPVSLVPPAEPMDMAPPEHTLQVPPSSVTTPVVMGEAPAATRDYQVTPQEVTSADPEFKSPAHGKKNKKVADIAPMDDMSAAPASMAPIADNSAHVLTPPPGIDDASAGAPMVEPYNDSAPGLDPIVANTQPSSPAMSAEAMDAAIHMQGPWQANAGQSLHEVLSTWAQRANIELNWLSEYDYPLQASMTFNGSFEDAVRTLLSGFMNASPAPVGRLHRNTDLGQLALIIEARGNLYNE